MIKQTTRRLGALAIGIFAANAGAAVISDSDNFSFSNLSFYDYSYGGPNASAATRTRNSYVNLNGFDSSLGTLTDVTLSFTTNWGLGARISAEDTYNNWGTDYTNGSVRTTSTMTIDLVNPNGPESTRARAETTSCSDSGLWSAECSNSSYSNGTFNGGLNLAGIDLSEFLDTTVTLRITQLLGALLTSCDSDSDCYGWNTNNGWTGNLTIAYTYDEVSVPEPATLGLLGLGLLGLGVARRKAKA
ncbi:MAG: PEP-CTERM sorting domain-containing protein [Gammaproteobacteria bacterium]